MRHLFYLHNLRLPGQNGCSEDEEQDIRSFVHIFP